MLLVDIGNTWTKSAYCYDGLLNYATPIKTANFLSQKLDGWPFAAEISKKPEKIHISSVASKNINENCRRFLVSTMAVEPNFVEVSKTYKGLTTLYRVDNLGVDRWLACLAAWFVKAENLVVVDAGTAITVDFIDKNGTHRGGLISPGPSAMMSALEKNTALLSATAGHLEKFVVPRNTEDAIIGGIEYSIKGFLQQIKFNSSGIFESEPLWVLTGGAAKRLSPGINWPHIKRQNLVLEGLKIFASP